MLSLAELKTAEKIQTVGQVSRVDLKCSIAKCFIQHGLISGINYCPASQE